VRQTSFLTIDIFHENADGRFKLDIPEAVVSIPRTDDAAKLATTTWSKSATIKSAAKKIIDRFLRKSTTRTSETASRN
jgi:hypothetical protein